MKYGFAAASTLLAIAVASCGSPRQSSADKQPDTHIPAEDAFQSMLERDLLTYFSALSSIRVTKVDATLLRDAPAASGVASPYYYAWVVLRSETNEARSGAVRVASVEKTRFEVTDFLSSETLRADSMAAARVFPEELVADINRRAQ